MTRRTLLAASGTAALSLSMDGDSLRTDDPLTWTLAEAANALGRKAVSSEELTKLCFARIGQVEPKLNTVITLLEESALKQARRSDALRAAGKIKNRLHGVPIALKDNIDTADVKTTAGSSVFRERVPQQDSEVAARLKDAGLICIAKLNLDEMAFAGTGTTSCFGPVHNPWNVDHITGGSSAGSAAGVATGMCFGSVGSDDGGSVRIPGAFCGVVGFKTSYGRVSTRGVIPSAYSMDTIGPITRSVEDAAVLLQILAGYDSQDSITLDRPVPDYWKSLRAPINHLRIGIPRQYFFEQLHPDVAAAVETAIHQLEHRVREVREVTLHRLQIEENGDYDAELYHYQKQFFDNTPELYHPWSREQLSKLKQVQTVAYIETLKRVRECRRDIRKTFEAVDILILPTMREPAPLIAETINRQHHRPPSNTSAFNHFGTPAITAPCGFSKSGLPIGLQIVAAAYNEPALLSVAYAFQQATDWHKRRPRV
jgi:aspartyl-tRNA(Asn)/glutamyl-tRNA(Gln) amidotransferase subunit A